MKMIEVFNLMAKKEIKHETLLIVYYESVGYVYKYHKLYRTFLNDDSKRIEEDFVFGDDFLNFDVKLIPPKEKKYLIKLTIKGIDDENTYINLNRKRNVLFLSDNYEGQYYQRKFTKQEMRDIQLVRELLEDMQGKYELVEVDE